MSEFGVSVALPTTRCLPNCVPWNPAVPRYKSKGFPHENYITVLKGDSSSCNIITDLIKILFVSVAQLSSRSNISEMFQRLEQKQ